MRRVFDATAVRSLFVRLSRLERDAEALHARRISVLVEAHAGDADARVIAAGHQPREEVHLAVRAADGGRIEHTFGFKGGILLRRHEHAQARDRKRCSGFAAKGNQGRAGHDIPDCDRNIRLQILPALCRNDVREGDSLARKAGDFGARFLYHRHSGVSPFWWMTSCCAWIHA